MYQALAPRVALHASESEEYVFTRGLTYCLEYEDGICFWRGVSQAACR